MGLLLKKWKANQYCPVCKKLFRNRIDGLREFLNPTEFNSNCPDCGNLLETPDVRFCYKCKKTYIQASQSDCPQCNETLTKIEDAYSYYEIFKKGLRKGSAISVFLHIITKLSAILAIVTLLALLFMTLSTIPHNYKIIADWYQKLSIRIFGMEWVGVVVLFLIFYYWLYLILVIYLELKDRREKTNRAREWNIDEDNDEKMYR